MNAYDCQRPVTEDTSADIQQADWMSLSLSELCDHIEVVHHAYLRKELPRLRGELTAAVERNRSWARFLVPFEALQFELVPHMMKEERVVFPMIRQLDTTGRLPQVNCGGLTQPILVMESEHDAAMTALCELRRISNDYQAPADECPASRELVNDLARLDRDLRLHIHKENNVLFPRALARQRCE